MFADRSLCERRLAVLCLFIYIVAVTLGAFTGGLWATLGIGLATVLFFGVWFIDKKMPQPPKELTQFACVALACFAMELPLSSQVALSGKVWVQLASIFLTLILLTSQRLQTATLSRSFVPVVALAAGIGAVALGFELLSGGTLIHLLKKPGASLTEYNRGIAHLVILAFPLFAGLWISGKRSVAVVLALVLLFPACLTESRTAKLALIVGVACAAAAFYRPLWARRGLAAGAVAIMGWPFYAQYIFSTAYPTVENLPPSWRHRVEIWDYLSYRIAERPFFGWGLGTTHMLDFSQPHGNLYKFAVQGAPHAHNFVTELWVETGLVGLALGFVFLLLTLRSAFALHASLRPFALGGWAAAVAVSMFGFDFWTDALWAAFALSAFAFGMLQQQLERGENLVDA
ncbi:MAG: O-antigen ligase family protein [Alphaproteobacteria bacterium]